LYVCECNLLDPNWLTGCGLSKQVLFGFIQRNQTMFGSKLNMYLVAGFTHFLYSIIYGMSSFPLTNSYFSRWLVNHQPVFFWRFFLVNFQQKQNTSHSGPGTLQVARARIFVLSLAAGPCPSPKNARSFGGAGDYRCFF
jgi:hypothetical protein